MSRRSRIFRLRRALLLGAFLCLYAATGRGQTIYGAAHVGPDGPASLYRIDPATGAATPVGPIGFERCSGMDFGPTGTLFATCERSDGTDTHVLVTVDTSTGAGTEVGPTGVEITGFGDTVSDLSFRSDGALFAYLEPEDAVGRIDPSTGSVSLVLGGSGVECCGNGIAFSPGEVLFHANENALHTLDQNTGEATVVVDLEFLPPAEGFSRVNAMDFDPGTGVLFASVVSGLDFVGTDNFLATIDPTTGVVSVIGPTQRGLDAIAVAPASEPTPVRAPVLGVWGLLTLCLLLRLPRAVAGRPEPLAPSDRPSRGPVRTTRGARNAAGAEFPPSAGQAGKKEREPETLGCAREHRRRTRAGAKQSVRKYEVEISPGNSETWSPVTS
ncbi:MAG: hypothetical protein KatS3mg076_2635 [Candidatus Binatia bacterium]|nr:MAG: hypothetical protein KatS3mg076_2635 [Candidatus Binatia bacterium]